MSLSSHARIKYSSARGQYIATQRSIRHGEGSSFTPALKKTIEHWTPEQIASKVQSVDISASTIRNWIRQGMLDVKPYVYRRRKSKKLNKRETEIAEQQARKKEELAYLQEKLRDQNTLIPRISLLISSARLSQISVKNINVLIVTGAVYRLLDATANIVGLRLTSDS